MREILFKGIRVDTKEWVEGDLLNCYNGNKRILQELPMEPEGDLGTENNLVIPKTVCQFTGLLDKNGVKIFEGDECIIDTISMKKRIVKYLNVGFYICLGNNISYPINEYYKEIEVTGNIHDNN